MDIRQLLQGAGRFATAMVDPEFERRKAAEEARLAQAKAQTELTGAQVGLTGAETERARAGTETERLQGSRIQQQMDEIDRARKEWQAAVDSGLLKGQNAEVQKAYIDAAEADVRKTANEAAAEASRASAAHSRAATSVLLDPTERALKLAGLRDTLRYQRARTAATEALTSNRERGPARPPSSDAALRAQNYAEKNVNRGRASVLARHLPFGLASDAPAELEKNTPEYMKEIARLKQEYYRANPETSGGWAAGGGNLSDNATPGLLGSASGLSDGIYTDPTSGQMFAVKGGQVMLLRDQPTGNPTGLGGPSVNPENDY